MRLEQRDAAIDCFVSSVTGRPYNWSAWTQLAQLIESADKVGVLRQFLTHCPTCRGYDPKLGTEPFPPFLPCYIR